MHLSEENNTNRFMACKESEVTMRPVVIAYLFVGCRLVPQMFLGDKA